MSGIVAPTKNPSTTAHPLRRLKVLLVSLAVAFGFLHLWLGRVGVHGIDSVSYMDMGMPLLEATGALPRMEFGVPSILCFWGRPCGWRSPLLLGSFSWSTSLDSFSTSQRSSASTSFGASSGEHCARGLRRSRGGGLFFPIVLGCSSDTACSSGFRC